MSNNESGGQSFIPNDEEEDVMEFKIPKMLKDLKAEYHDTVRKVYEMYSPVTKADHMVPVLDDPTREFQESDVVASLETLDEFVDRHHPMWKQDREVCFQSLSKDNPEDGSDLAAYIHKKWGNQTIDTSENLSHIVRVNPTRTQTRNSGAGYNDLEFNNANRNRGANSEDVEEKSDIEKKYEYLCSIDIQTLKDEVLEREHVRLDRFLSMQNQSNGNGVHVHETGGHGAEQMFTRDQVERLVKAEGERKQWGVERTAQVVVGVHDIFDTRDCYNTTTRQSTIPRSHVDEILSVEEAYNMICNVYHDN